MYGCTYSSKQVTARNTGARRSAYQHCRRCRCLDTGRPVRWRSAGRRAGGFFEVQGHSDSPQLLLLLFGGRMARPFGGRGRAVARLRYLVIAQSLNIWAVRPPSQSTHRPTREAGQLLPISVTLPAVPPRCTRLPLSMSPRAFTATCWWLRVVQNIDFVWGVIIAIKICHDTASTSRYSIRYDISCHH